MTISVGHGKGKASQLQTSPSSHVFCFTGYKLRKTDPESSNYLRYRTRNVFPDCDCFCSPFRKRDAADNLSRTLNVHDFWQCLFHCHPRYLRIFHHNKLFVFQSSFQSFGLFASVSDLCHSLADQQIRFGR